RFKDKTVVSVHGFKSISKNIINKLVYNKANSVYCVSYKMALNLIESCNVSEEKVSVVYNPYDLESIQAQSKQIIEREITYPTIVSVGRLTSVKGYRQLLKSFKIALK